MLFLISTSGMLVTFCIWMACAATYANTGVQAAGNTVLAMIFIYYIFYNLAWSELLIKYGAEVLPYNLSAKGLALMFLMVNIVLFFNQYVNPIALENIRLEVLYSVLRMASGKTPQHANLEVKC